MEVRRGAHSTAPKKAGRGHVAMMTSRKFGNTCRSGCSVGKAILKNLGVPTKLGWMSASYIARGWDLTSDLGKRCRSLEEYTTPRRDGKGFSSIWHPSWPLGLEFRMTLLGGNGHYSVELENVTPTYGDRPGKKG